MRHLNEDITKPDFWKRSLSVVEAQITRFGETPRTLGRMTPFANQRLLFVRLDRIGDLVLTLPVDSAVEGADVDWWIPQRLGFVAMLSQPRAQGARSFASDFISPLFRSLERNSVCRLRWQPSSSMRPGG